MAYIRVWVELPPWHGHKKQHWYAGWCIFSCVTLPQLFVKTVSWTERRTWCPGHCTSAIQWLKFRDPPAHPMTFKIHKPLMPSCDKYLLMAFQKLLRSNLYTHQSFEKLPCSSSHTRQILLGDTLQITQLHTCLYKILWLFLGIFQPLSGNSLMVSFRTHDFFPSLLSSSRFDGTIESSNRNLWSEVTIYEAQQLAVASCKLEKSHLRFFMLWMEKSVGAMLK